MKLYRQDAINLDGRVGTDDFEEVAFDFEDLVEDELLDDFEPEWSLVEANLNLKINSFNKEQQSIRLV
ncbi:hypothetical protein BLOT_008628 [Blomia tropicalis]|nr:hypothetical protein BLOT_008628 [Blomia tropicalis]